MSEPQPARRGREPAAPAPAGTTKEIANRLHRDFKSIVARLEFEQQVVKMDLISIGSPAPDEPQRFLHAEIERWGKLVHQVGIAIGVAAMHAENRCDEDISPPAIALVIIGRQR